HIIVPLTAVDNVTHLRAILQLRVVAQDNDAIKRIIQRRKNSDINEILKNYSNKEARENGWDSN
ncbi:PTS sugar transporter subunit IIA, partial [Klebsiella pneumoniae]|uniref:PTS sugar transporter subunit IIA n=1 Tax=Klebsiella pneumoniae TaxID=573 RepID=UPI0013A59008